MAGKRHDDLLTHDVDDQKVSDLGFSEQQLQRVTPKVRELRVRDLNDFARRMSGHPVDNKTVLGLTVEDIKGIESLFNSYREQTLEALTRQGAVANLAAVRELSISISCCCCTPCCSCCAAVDLDPFAQSA